VLASIVTVMRAAFAVGCVSGMVLAGPSERLRDLEESRAALVMSTPFRG
jgi:hypothetical protein